MLTMDWQINLVIVLAVLVTCVYMYEGGFIEEMTTVLFNCKQIHITHVPLGLGKQNKDFQTLYEQDNKMVYSFNRFEPCYSE